MSSVISDYFEYKAPPTPHQLSAVVHSGLRSKPLSVGVSLLEKLQTSLDPNVILQIFSDDLQALIKQQGIRFESQNGLELVQGQTAAFEQIIPVYVGDLYLGRLSLYRETSFDHEELHLIELAAHWLRYPLHNALQHHNAQRAMLNDKLTGVHNRMAFDLMLASTIERSQRTQECLGMIVLDIDHFKQINDSLGHSEGDEVLKALANALKKSVRSADSVYRFGGDEFVLILTNTNKTELEHVARRIQKNVNLFDLGHPDKRFTVSMGLQIWQKGSSAEAFFRQADAALYRSKQAGRNQYSF